MQKDFDAFFSLSLSLRPLNIISNVRSRQCVCPILSCNVYISAHFNDGAITASTTNGWLMSIILDLPRSPSLSVSQNVFAQWNFHVFFQSFINYILTHTQTWDEATKWYITVIVKLMFLFLFLLPSLRLLLFLLAFNFIFLFFFIFMWSNSNQIIEFEL